MCVELVDGTLMLNANTDLTCWEGEHIVLSVASVIFLLLYVVGIPVAFMFVLHRYKRRNMLNDDVVMARLGFLYLRYEPSW